MSSWQGYVTYLNYVAGSDKGGVRRGDLFNGVYAMGQMNEDRMNYTGERVVETIPEGVDFMALAWTPVIGSVKVTDQFGNDVPFELKKAEDLKYFFDKRLNPNHYDADRVYQGAIAADAAAIEAQEAIIANPDSTAEQIEAAKKQIEQLKAEARMINLGEYKYPEEANPDGWRGGYGTNAKSDLEGKWAVILDPTIEGMKRVSYIYDNVVIPQDDLPILSAHLESVHLQARARRIAIYFSQISAFQAQAEYGLNLGDQLAEQAVGELAYEIDSEIVFGLVDAAPMKAGLTFQQNDRIGVSLADHYAGFAAVLERAKAMIFKATQKFSPNFMICAPDVLVVLAFAPGFVQAPAANVAGPYMAGTLNGLKVFVSPMMKDGEFVIGVNGSDMKTAAAVYAPFMPIVPTQLLQFADGGNSQGFSTLYDFQILSKLPAGFKEDSIQGLYEGRVSTEDRPFSPLLVKGMIYTK